MRAWELAMFSVVRIEAEEEVEKAVDLEGEASYLVCCSRLPLHFIHRLRIRIYIMLLALATAPTPPPPHSLPPTLPQHQYLRTSFRSSTCPRRIAVTVCRISTGPRRLGPNSWCTFMCGCMYPVCVCCVCVCVCVCSVCTDMCACIKCVYVRTHLYSNGNDPRLQTLE